MMNENKYKSFVGKKVRYLRELLFSEGFEEYDYCYYNNLLFSNKELGISIKVLCEKIPLFKEDNVDDKTIYTVEILDYFVPDYEAMKNVEEAALLAYLNVWNLQLSVVENRELTIDEILDDRNEQIAQFKSKLLSDFDKVVKKYFEEDY